MPVMLQLVLSPNVSGLYSIRFLLAGTKCAGDAAAWAVSVLYSTQVFLGGMKCASDASVCAKMTRLMMIQVKPYHDS